MTKISGPVYNPHVMNVYNTIFKNDYKPGSIFVNLQTAELPGFKLFSLMIVIKSYSSCIASLLRLCFSDCEPIKIKCHVMRARNCTVDHKSQFRLRPLNRWV